ncbi:MAG: SpoIIE family protein phosphatase [Verrucomicrobiota bacterium]
MAPNSIIFAETQALELGCDLHAVAQMLGQSRQFFSAAGLVAAEMDGWELALAEAANNAVNYATPEGKELPIRLDLIVTGQWIEVRVTDHTAGFDFPETAQLPPEDSESGRGLFLIQSLTDEAHYLRGRTENCLVLRKRRAAPDSALTLLQPADAARELREGTRTLDLMTKELASSYESLAAIFRFSAELQSGINSESFLQRWINQLLDITESDWCVLRLVEHQGKELDIVAISDRDWQDQPVGPERGSATERSIEARAAAQHKDVWFDAASPLAPDDPLAGLAGAGHGFAHPLFANDVMIGVLTAGRRGELQFDAGQIGVIQTFGDFMGLQIRSRQMQEEHIRVRINTRDLEIAANIQRALLPEHLPSVPGASFASFYRSAREISGDYYDALPSDDGNLLLVVADVMGKGLPAAMFAFMFRSLVRARRELASRPGEFLAWLNQNLFEELERAEMFITAQLAFLDCRRGEIRVAGAGHPPFLSANSAGEVTEICSGGPPLGIVPGATFPEACHALSGSRFLMFTDGLFEARNPNGDLLGLEAVKSSLASAGRAGESSEVIERRFASLLRDFEQGSPMSDDTAFIVIAGNDTIRHD